MSTPGYREGLQEEGPEREGVESAVIKSGGTYIIETSVFTITICYTYWAGRFLI